MSRIATLLTTRLADEVFEQVLGGAIGAAVGVLTKTLAETALTGLKLLSSLLEFFDGVGEIQFLAMILDFFLAKYDVGNLGKYEDNR